jgi:hypothetical protein
MASAELGEAQLMRAAIDRLTVGAAPIEIVLSGSVVAEGQDRP